MGDFRTFPVSERVIHYKDRTVVELRTAIRLHDPQAPKLKRITMDFTGNQWSEPPRVDDFLRAQGAARTRRPRFYHVAQVREVKRRIDGPRRFVLMCWPTDEAMMMKADETQRIFDFVWWPRKKAAPKA